MPMDVGACWIRETEFEISDCLLPDIPRKPPPAGGAGGRKPWDGFNGVICGWSVDGNGWFWDWLDNTETGDGRVKLPVDVVSLPE